MEQILAPINQFLGCETPDEWIAFASRRESLPTLLIDHCNCELKAAQTAIALLRKYAVNDVSQDALKQWAQPYADLVYDKQRDVDAFLNADNKKNDIASALTAVTTLSISEDLIDKMVRLVKEEFHHFEQVLQIMQKRGIAYENRRAGRYAKQLIAQVRTYEPQALIDKLIIGAFIEARSCERFAKLSPHLDEELSKFYVSLLRSEARHYQDYLSLAQSLSDEDIAPRVAQFAEIEATLIQSPDEQFQFHSGIPSF
ncbi:tRNA-(ms[2]io[6]A)-hydroxylase [Shewanella maritima]|uniref:tRNA isopentenyl-2-thiomethyl-A-37 hydroxylase MiaE n=1 Tax=Shewanella maritima TaxID=2520507 RepID=UPI003737003D